MGDYKLTHQCMTFNAETKSITTSKLKGTVNVPSKAVDKVSTQPQDQLQSGRNILTLESDPVCISVNAVEICFQNAGDWRERTKRNVMPW